MKVCQSDRQQLDEAAMYTFRTVYSEILTEKSPCNTRRPTQQERWDCQAEAMRYLSKPGSIYFNLLVCGEFSLITVEVKSEN